MILCLCVFEYQAQASIQKGDDATGRGGSKKKPRHRHVLMSQRQIESDLIRIRSNADWIDRGNEVRNLAQ